MGLSSLLPATVSGGVGCKGGSPWVIGSWVVDNGGDITGEAGEVARVYLECGNSWGIELCNGGGVAGFCRADNESNSASSVPFSYSGTNY